MTPEFLTQGELIKFVFNAAGLLPTKHKEKDDFDGAKKKTIQKALGRLASEDGKLGERFNDMTKLLSGELWESVQQGRVILAMGDVLFDLFEVYNGVIRDEGTYLEKSETVRWIVQQHLVPRLVISVNKHLLGYNIAADKLLAPQDPYWFLPSIDSGKTTWPLEKVMRWAYALCNCSHTHFHYPGKNPGKNDPSLQQNLESAANWLAGKGVPSLTVLLRNFDKSFEALGACEVFEHRRQIPELIKQSIKVALLIARISTYVCKEIEQHFSTAFLTELIAQYCRYSDWITEDTDAIRHFVADCERKNDVPSEYSDVLWRDASDRYWGWVSEKAMHAAYALNEILAQNENGVVPEKVAQSLAETYGKFIIFGEIEGLNRQKLISAPIGFGEQIFVGFDLKKNPELTETQIDHYEQALKTSDVERVLPWMVPWLRAVLFYRREEFESAYPWFQLAFEQAKYCAGSHQYKLVNQYVEVCAKTDRWKDFKKGIDWAQYLNIEIRWLRQDEPTDERLDYVFWMLKRANYPHL